MTTPITKRPREVWTVSILLFCFGLLGTVLSLFLAGLVAGEDDIPGFVTFAVYAGAVLAAAEILAGVFVFLGREWARRIAIAVCVLNGLSGLVTLASGVVLQALVGIVVNIALIVNLSKDEVRYWCRPD
ncbi:hypothetical protein ACPPVO_17075 [Dactylosporangium sp. McL0621]|uniref:hypothetical protein n=1 Tax=Dactylosporangium sp. McL0621 TaxID=3415678 RepID=UPI003CE6C713